MGRYQLQVKQSPPPGALTRPSAGSSARWRLRPTDGVARMVYAIYLTRKGDRDAALTRYLEAREADSGVLRAALQPRPAVRQSWNAMTTPSREAAEGLCRRISAPGLNKLIRLGVWREPPITAAPEPETSGTQSDDAGEAPSGAMRMARGHLDDRGRSGFKTGGAVNVTWKTSGCCSPIRCSSAPARQSLTADAVLLGALPELDSQAVVQLITAIEDHFGCVVADDEVSADTFATFGTLTEFVASKCA